MERKITALILVVLFVAFTTFTMILNRQKTVFSLVTPTKITVTDGKKLENICLDNIEAFSLEPPEYFYDKYSKSLNLSNSDMVGLGFLAQDFAQKTLLNKKVSLNYSTKLTPECKFADIKLNGLEYSKILYNTGFSIENDNVYKEKFDKNLEAARKLNLVILNHHSNKYHTLDCPYGKVAHDSVIIPQKQLPKNAKPCQFCHNTAPAIYKKFKFKKDVDIINVNNIISPPLIVKGGAITVFHTDYTNTSKPVRECKTKVCNELVNLIDSAKSSIDIAIYGYENIQQITQALKRASSRGVKIRFVYDEKYDTTKTYYKDNDIIKNLSVAFRSDRNNSKTQSDMLMHNKFVIFDEKVVYTGSLNFSSSGMSGYDVNTVVIINSFEVAKLFTKEFEQMLNGKFHNSKMRISDSNIFKIDNTELEVYFSPQDNSVARIVELINSSKEYVYLPTFLITQKDISNALIAARKRGVDVRLIIDANSTSTSNSKHATLRANSILLKTENYGGKLHSKSIIIDDKYVITGSMNFSNSGKSKNDENVLIINNSAIAKNYKAFFLYLWTKISNKYLKYNAKPESLESIGSCNDGVDNNFNGKIDLEEEFCKVK